MTVRRLLDEFDRLADAPSALPHLRRFIFDLSIRGLLATRSTDDEPAAALLERIRTEELPATRRRQQPEDVTDAPFAVPPTWEWTRLGNLGRIFSGTSVSPARREELSSVRAGYPFIATKDVGYGDPLNYDTGLRVPQDTPGFKVAHAAAVLICAEGGSAGRKMGITDRDVCFGNKLFANETWSGIYPEYLAVVYRSSMFLTEFRERMTGIIGGIARGAFVQIPVPVPPSDEQRRIVAKVHELMALCDELNAAQEERERRRDRTAIASLRHLTSVNGASDTPQAGVFLDNASLLIKRPEHVASVREAILDLAVHGRLVPQSPDDEPATALAERLEVAATTDVDARRVQRRRQRKHDTLAPFRIPPTWLWVAVLDIGMTTTGSTPPSDNPDFFGSHIPFVTPGDLDGRVVSYSGRWLSKAGLERTRLIPQQSVLMVCIGSSIGKVGVTDREIACNQQINALTPYLSDLYRFAGFAMQAHYFRSLVDKAAGRGTLPIISKGKWERLPIPLPPLAEQRRIVAKVDELMAVCDELERSLAAVQTGRSRLLEAVLHEALPSSMGSLPTHA